MGFRYGITIAKVFIIVLLNFIMVSVNAQTAGAIKKEINDINRRIVTAPYKNGQGMLVSNKAMSMFLSNKLSYYLSENTDLSLYKNYVTLNTAEGNVNITHNFHQPVDRDDYIHSFTMMGARLNIANTFAAKYANKYFDNQISFMLQKTWMARPGTKFKDQRIAMDASRSIIVQQLGEEIAKEAGDFELSLNLIKAEEVPGQDLNIVKQKLTQEFYAKLRETYLQKFSEAQSNQLIHAEGFNTVTSNWTSLAIYIPIIRQRFEVSPAANQHTTPRYNYPLELSITHTRFVESIKYGKLIMSANVKGKYNNSVQSGDLLQADINGSAPINIGNSFIGDYQNFLTPVIAGKLVYFPPTSHFGISYRVEKNFGSYHALNSILGVPIVLIDKKDVPVVNFEVQLLYSDMNNTMKDKPMPYNKIAVGFTVGIPFSKVVL